MTDWTLYYAAQDADNAYQRELIRVYGKRNAGDARYKLRHDDPAVQSAKLAYINASDAWIKYCEELRNA